MRSCRRSITNFLTVSADRGFFTMNHPVKDISDKLMKLYLQVDSHSLEGSLTYRLWKYVSWVHDCKQARP